MADSESKFDISRYYRIITVLTILAYIAIQSFCVSADFFSMDDSDELTFVRQADSIWALMTRDGFSLFRPIKNFVFLAFAFLEDAWLCRSLAILIGILTYFPVRAMGRRIFGSEGLGLAFAAIWLLAPTQVSCVAWLSCVNIQIMAGACAMAFVFHDRSGDCSGGCRRRFAALSSLCYFLALCSYECALALPGMFFFHDLCMRTDRLKDRSTWKIYTVYGLVAVGYMILRTAFSAANELHGSFPPGVTRIQLIAASALFLVEHLQSWAWPFGRMAVLGYYSPWITPSWVLALSWSLPVVMLAVAAFCWKRNRMVTFGIMSFFALYFPVSNVLGLGNNPYGDYYLAIASFGLVTMLVEVLRLLIVHRKGRPLLLGLAVLLTGVRVLAVAEAASWADAWGDPEKAFADGLRTFPSSVNNEQMLIKTRAHRGNLSVALDTEDLERRCLAAHEPMYILYQVKALYFGNVVKDADRALGFLDKYRQELPEPPHGYGWYHYYRGCLLEDLKNDAVAAKAEYLKALEVETPGRPSAPYFDRAAIACVRDGDLANALMLWEHAVALDPTLASVHYNYSMTLRAAGRLEESEYHLRKAMSLEGRTGVKK